RSASRQMSRPAISIQSNGGWTFGSPSVLMMFYRGAGELESELAEMDECMPHYYKITNGHGQGAEKIMRAEAAFAQGRFTDAHIELESAYAQIEGNGQENMALCCDFLAWRLSLYTEYTDAALPLAFEERRVELLRHHNVSWINLLNAALAYYYALLGEAEKTPAVFSKHRLSEVNILAPGRPMIEMIENQVYLAQGAYAKVIGRGEGMLAVCGGMHYALVALHVRIQMAAAYERLGKREEARALLSQALSDALPDGLVMPFVENYGYIKPLLEEKLQSDEGAARIIALGEEAARRKEEKARPEAFSSLTEREYEIVGLMAGRLSNREIAEKLFLSEGSVKQYVNQIYSKLHIEGDTRVKRKQLADLFLQKT
ncbi:MAG: LuxR C-terminal-related transcriptional regulator, partial [Oscillospiraceae bacterium]|nr:LuxR C-terminal-related transcriptional regulator [Oscillospiraceae bacterium]